MAKTTTAKKAAEAAPAQQTAPETVADDAPKPAARPGKHRTLAHAKLAVMREVGFIQKKKKGEVKYTYASEEEIVEAIHLAMYNHGMVVCPIKVEVEHYGTYQTKHGATMNAAVLLITYRLTHADSGEFEDGMAAGEGADIGDKAVNKASTGAYKYFFRQAFVIRTGDDPDQHASEPMERRSEPAAQPGVSRPAPTQPPAQPPPQTNGTNGHGKPPAGLVSGPAPKERPLDTRPPEERPRAPEEDYNKVVDALKRANAKDTLDNYRAIYSGQTRSFNRDQINDLDKVYFDQVKRVAAGAAGRN